MTRVDEPVTKSLRGQLMTGLAVLIAVLFRAAAVSFAAGDVMSLTEGCGAGKAADCQELGIMYSSGTGGVGRDLGSAAIFYGKACEADDAKRCIACAVSCRFLGEMFEDGSGVKKDLPRAAKLYSQACDGADSEACVALGILYQDGSGVPKDTERAAALYRQACAGQDSGGCALVEALSSGSSRSARDVARIAREKGECDLGLVSACAILGDEYQRGSSVAKDMTRAVALYERACAGGAPDGCLNLAFVYMDGSAGTKDTARAVTAAQRACDAHIALGCHLLSTLGRFLDAGWDFKKDPVKDPVRAGQLLRQACDGGFQPACRRIEAWRFKDLHLNVFTEHLGANVAYLSSSSGALWSVKPGQRLLDGEIGSVTRDSLSFRRDDGSTETHRLFEGHEPAPLKLPDDEKTGSPVSVDIDADVGGLAEIMADVSGLNIIVESGSSGRVRIAARNAPWDGVLARALADSGFAYKISHAIVAIGRPDRLAKMSVPSVTWSGAPVTLFIRQADMKDISALFANISGLKVEMPSASCDSVSVFFNEVPWDQTLAWIIASCGWTYRQDKGVIRMHAPAGHP